MAADAEDPGEATGATAREGAIVRAPADAKDALVGARVAHFLIRSKLGAGGMGVVYEAVDERLGRVVALKMLLSRIESPEMRRRFVREARAASKIHHPHVATIFEAGDADVGAYIAMEYVAGETLRRWLREPRPLPEKLRIACEIADALGTAHENGIVHRDLKPDNVMVTTQGAAKVLDFGLATQADTGSLGTDDTRTAEGIVVGTPNYMSPEQVRGAVLDARSDVFSFGVLLYEALAGERPFRGATPAAVFLALGGQDPQPPRQLAPEISRALEAVVLRCLAKRPDDRYPNGIAVARALEEVARGDAARPNARARARAATALAGVGAVLAIVLGYRAATAPAPTSPAPNVRSAIADSSAPIVATVEGRDAALDQRAAIDAVEAMRRGLRAERELAEAPCAPFEEATRGAPQLAGGHLRLATCRFVFSNDVAAARSAFREATRLRDSLGERDRALLDAWEPTLGREQADRAEARARNVALATRFVDDGELAMFAAAAEDDVAQADGAALALCRQLAELDPGSAFAQARIARLEREAGRADESRRAVERCLQIAPNALACSLERIALATARGTCVEVEAAAASIAGASETRPAYALAIGNALLGSGRSVEEARGTLEGMLADAGRDRDRSDLALVRARLDIVAGDFDAAIQRLQAIDAGQRSEEPLVRGSLLASALREAGRDEEAARAEKALADLATTARKAPRSNAEAGRAAKQAGRDDEAVASFERATRACDLLSSPFDHLESAFALGQLRETRGDRAGACAAYESVLARWRDAKPRSLTARKARARSSALACTR